jgi:hypothetical protein
MSGILHNLGRKVRGEPASMESHNKTRGWTTQDYAKRFQYLLDNELARPAADPKHNDGINQLLRGLARYLSLINEGRPDGDGEFKSLQGSLSALLVAAKTNPEVFAPGRKIIIEELNTLFDYLSTTYKVETRMAIRNLSRAQASVAAANARAAAVEARAAAGAGGTPPPTEGLLMLQERLRILRGEDSRTTGNVASDLERRLRALRGFAGGKQRSRRNVRRSRRAHSTRRSRRNNDYLEHGI